MPGPSLDLTFLQEGGDMGLLMREKDWGATALGAPAAWPKSLKTAVSLLLRARQPMFIGWGATLCSLYNDGYIPICGSKHPDALGRPMAQVWADIWDELSPLNEAVLRGESLSFEDMPFALEGRGDPRPSYFSFSYTPLLDDDGRIGGIFCSAIETTRSVRLLEARREENERQRRLFEQAPGFICTLQGPDHVFDFVNAAYQRMFGRKDIVGKSVREAFPELEGQGLYERLDEVYRTGERYVADGIPIRFRLSPEAPEREYLLSFVYAPVYDEHGDITGIFCEGHDVTESYAVKAALQEREEQLRLATDAAEIGLWDVDVVRGQLFWPPRVKAMFGISPDLPVTMADFYAGLHPEDRERVTAAFAAACEPQERALYDVEYRTIGKEDGVERWVAAKGRGIFDAGGRCVRVIGTAIDISARKAAETEQREADRRKDEFIATLAHELRNPLAPLRNAVHVLRGRGEQDALMARLLAMMERQLGHLVRLVDDLLETSRITLGTVELRTTHVRAASFIEAAVEACEPLLRERRHALQLDLGGQPAWVRGDAVRLAQVVSNLLTNAARYTPPGGAVRVALRAEGPHAVVAVTDNGRGFAADQAERIFGLFVHGEDSGGLGIGLALSRKLALVHGGTLEAHSAGPGRGATFTLRLPLVEAPEEQAAAEPAANQEPGGLRVLVVDDNTDAGDSLEILLRHLGAEVAVARDGASALEAFRRVQPALVLLDIGMPHMDGYEVARRLRAEHPQGGFRIVGLSGWGQAADRERGAAAGFDHHLVKPAEIEALQGLLQRARG